MVNRPAFLFVLLLLLVALAAGSLVPGDSGDRAEAAVADRQCMACHQGMDLAGSAHRVLRITMPGSSCEACHGMGDEHVQEPFQNSMMKNLTPAERVDLCLSCHATGPKHVTDWAGTAWAREGKTCSDCHSVHSPTENRLDFAADEGGRIGDASCRMCHAPVFESFARSFHESVLALPGGSCEICHGPGEAHAEGALELGEGGGEARIVSEPATASCLTCHGAIPERHAREMPVYREKRPDCIVCHDIHVDRENPLFADGESPFGAEESLPAETCATCHVSAVESAASSVHAPVVAEQGCDACHGPAKAHVLSGGRARFIRNPLDEPPEQASRDCLSCHSGPEAPEHARNWFKGPLAERGLSCLTCHQAHGGAEIQGRPILPEGTVPAEGEHYVGSASCSICHENPHPGIERSIHAGLVSDPEQAGCEACHGPGSAHVLSGGDPVAIRDPGNLPAGRRDRFCLECHGNSRSLLAWDRGVHATNDLECATCHDALSPAEENSIKRDPELCLSCHGEVGAEFRLPNSHPLDRGAVQCSSCHDPHRAMRGFQSLETRKDSCFECHRDKQGPFLFEHEADRSDGCLACHKPHGSVNRRLLTHRNVRDLCIQCHVTPASHGLAPGSVFRNCLNCHGSIHGSYVDKRFFR